MPTPRRPGDPHPHRPGRVGDRGLALLALPLLLAAAQTASAAQTPPAPVTPTPPKPGTPTPTATPPGDPSAPVSGTTTSSPRSGTPPTSGTTSSTSGTTTSPPSASRNETPPPRTGTPPTSGTTTSPTPTPRTGTPTSTSPSGAAGAATSGTTTASAPSGAASLTTSGTTTTPTGLATSPNGTATPPPTDSTDAPTAGPTAAVPPAQASARVPARKPPRVDGPYIGGTLAAGGSFARVNNFPTPDPLSGGTASLRVGEAIYPWMTIGLEITGTWANRFADPRQRLLQGAALIDFGFLPVPRIPLSLHVGFGAGGGAVRQADRTARSGFGGAVFSGAVRYEIFPLAARKRPTRGGGFSLGPELGWLGFTPAAKGRPMSNTVYIGLFMGFYFGS